MKTSIDAATNSKGATFHAIQRKLHRLIYIFAFSLSVVSLIGCTTTPGSRTSIWPTRTAGASPTNAMGAAGVTGSIASTTQVVKGQFSSMGSAVSSAYGKAKTAISAPFGGTSETGDPTNLGTKPSVGPELYVMNGALHENQGNYTKALDSYSKALEIEPKNPPALLSTARLYDRQNQKDKAIEFYQKAATVEPNNAAIFADMGGLQARCGNLTAAQSELQKAVKLDPKSTAYRSALAGVMLDSGKAEAAMAELNQVNNSAMANYQMAYLHFTRKNIPATQQYLGSALQIDPNLKPARDLMASMGGAQNITQMAQQGQQTMQQAQGIYQQAGAIGSNIQGLMNTTPSSLAKPANSQTAIGQGQIPLPNIGVTSSPFSEQAARPSAALRR